MSGIGRPRIENPREYRVQVRFNELQRARLEAYCSRFHLKKSQVLMKGFEELERKVEQPEEDPSGKYRAIFTEVIELDPDEILRLILNAETESEKKFYVLIGDFLLQQEQKRAIAENVF